MEGENTVANAHLVLSASFTSCVNCCCRGLVEVFSMERTKCRFMEVRSWKQPCMHRRVHELTRKRHRNWGYSF
jgi:hypothetical protein